MSAIHKKDIILLHGLFGSLSNWSAVINQFSANYNVFAPKLPLSSGVMRKNSLTQLVKYLENYIEENEIDKPILIGNSLGGHIALLYALKNPNDLEKLILTGSSGLFENTLNTSFVRFKDYNYIKSKVEEVFHKKQVITKELIDDVYTTANNPLKALLLISIAKDAKKHNLKEDLHKISQPVLLVWGKQDTVTPPEVANEFYSYLPNAELKFIDNCGHVPMMEQPELFNHFLDQFLTA